MQDEIMTLLCSVEDILKKELIKEMKKIQDAGQFAPGQTKELKEAVECMIGMKEYEEWLNGMGMSEAAQRNASRMSYANNYGMNAYGPSRSPITGRFVSNGSYGYGYSGHSVRDRMISRLEDMMGDAKNEYEAQMIRDAIAQIQSGESR